MAESPKPPPRPPPDDTTGRFASPAEETGAAVAGTEGIAAFAASVARTLSDTPPWLDCRYLYDARGSELFEQICDLPEYYLTRVETEILQRAAPEIRECTGPLTLMELGSGTSVKTDYLIDAYLARDQRVRYVPVDVSDSALEQARQSLEARHPGARVTPIHGPYEAGFGELEALSPVMLVFLGSTLGNFNEAESALFWQEVSSHLSSGDFVLVGIDLIKDPAVLEAAYNDPQGVTAQFTRNLFHRMNRELHAGLDVDAIDHVVSYNAARRRIEIYARNNRAQDLEIHPRNESIHLPAGQMILTEISCKFDLDVMPHYLEQFGLKTCRIFTDAAGSFGVLLLRGAEVAQTS